MVSPQAYKNELEQQNKFLNDLKVIPIFGLETQRAHRKNPEGKTVIQLIQDNPEILAIYPTRNKTSGKWFVTTTKVNEILANEIIDTKIPEYIASTYKNSEEPEDSEEPPKRIQLPTHSTSIMTYAQAIAKSTPKTTLPYKHPHDSPKGTSNKPTVTTKTNKAKGPKLRPLYQYVAPPPRRLTSMNLKNAYNNSL